MEKNLYGKSIKRVSEIIHVKSYTNGFGVLCNSECFLISLPGLKASFENVVNHQHGL